MHQIVRRIATSKLLWSVAVLLLLYTLSGFFLAPYLIERYLPGYAEQHLGRRATVSAVRINPFLLTLEASGFQLEGSADSPLLSFKRLWVDFELSSIVRRAWTFAEVQIESLDLRLEIDGNGQLNLMQLVERLRGPEQTNKDPPRLIVEHLIVSDSRVNLVDLSVETHASTAFVPVDFELTGISTLPDSEGHYTLAANLPSGGSLAWKGVVSLQPLSSSGEINIKGIKLATVWQFFRDELSVAEPRGEFVLAGRYNFAYEKNKPLLKVSALQAEVSGLALASAVDARPLLALRSIRMSDARFMLANREFVVPSLQVSDGEMSANVADDGTLDWQRLLTGGPAGQARRVPSSGSESTGLPWRVRVERIGVEKVALTYTDRARTPALVFRAGALKGGFKLDATIGAGASHVVAEDIQFVLTGTALATTESDTPLATLDSFTLTGGRVDTRARAVLAQAVASNGGSVSIARGPDGPTGLLHVLSSASSQPTAARLSAEKPVGGAHSWRYRIDTVELKRTAVDLGDHSFKPAITYAIDVVTAALTHIDSASDAPIAFTTELRIGERGSVNSSGTLGQDFGRARAKLDAKGVALAPLQPLLARYARLDLKSGTLAAAGQLNYRPDGKAPFTAQGTASVHDFLMNEADTGDRFLSWRTLSAQSIAFSLAPNRLAIKELRVLEPGMKIEIAKDRSVNLTQVLRNDFPNAGQQPAASPAPPPASRSTREKQASTTFPVEVGRVRIEGGTLDFADLSLVLPFATRVHALDGFIVGVSSAPKSRAEVKLAGQIATYGEARAEGALMPWSPRTLLDIEAHFDNVLLPPLSPYTATFAGRKVAAGKLWIDLQYKIANGELAGVNKIVIQNMKLGERVAASHATDLPLELAIALLTDSKGRISLSVPVTGDVDNPQFDYGRVIRAAVVGAIKSVVTAPFRMLAGLFGKRSAEEFQKVEFAPGSDRIAPAQREKLDALAAALKERPQLTLVVNGPYDAKRDAQALRRDLARRAVARAVGTKLATGEDPGPVAYGDAGTQQALESLLSERAGTDALQALAREFPKLPKRTGGQSAQSIPSSDSDQGHAFYQAAFERLVELQPQPDSAPKVLASQRAQAIVDALESTGIARNRMQSGGIIEVSGKPDTPITSIFTLNATPASP